MRGLILFLMILVLSSALSLNAKAIAIASDYLESNTMELIEGDSRIYGIRIQNPDPADSRAKVTYDMEFAKAIEFQEEYIIPAGSSVAIQFNITAPKYNKKDNLFSIGFTAHQLTHAPGAGTQFLTSIHKKIKLQVVKSPDRLHVDYLSVAYGIILIVVIFFLYKKRTAKKRAKKGFR